MSTMMRNYWCQRKWISASSSKDQSLCWGFPETSMLNALLRISEQRNYLTLEIDEESDTRWTAIHRDTRQVFVVEMRNDPPLGPKEVNHWHDQTIPCDRTVSRTDTSGRKPMPEPSLLFAKPKQLDLL